VDCLGEQGRDSTPLGRAESGTRRGVRQDRREHEPQAVERGRIDDYALRLPMPGPANCAR